MTKAIALFALLSTSAFAQSLPATEALTNVLPVGEYTGTNCSVSVKETQRTVKVTVTQKNKSFTREIFANSMYSYSANANSFMNYEIEDIRGGRVETSLSTKALSNRTQVVKISSRDLARPDYVFAVECNINL